MSAFDEKPFPLDFNDLKLLSHMKEILAAWQEDGFPGMRQTLLKYENEFNAFNRKILAAYKATQRRTKPEARHDVCGNRFIRSWNCVLPILENPEKIATELNEQDKAWLKAMGIEPPDISLNAAARVDADELRAAMGLAGAAARLTGGRATLRWRRGGAPRRQSAAGMKGHE